MPYENYFSDDSLVTVVGAKELQLTSKIHWPGIRLFDRYYNFKISLDRDPGRIEYAIPSPALYNA